MRTWILVVIGAVLPLGLGATLGMATTDSGNETWAHPMQPTAFLFLSLGLAVSHLLILAGYLAVAERAGRPGATLARLGALGSALLAGCEVWSGLEARTDLDASRLTVLDTAFVVSSALVVFGTFGAGWALRGSALSAPLLVNGAFLAVAVVVKYTASDGLGIAALTIWSLLYVPLALRMRTSTGAAGTRQRV